MGLYFFYLLNFGLVVVGGIVGGCILFIIGVFIVVFVLWYSIFDYVFFNLEIIKILLWC